MGPAVKLDFEWQEAPGVRDKVLATTWARLDLSIGDLCASEAIDLRSNSRRTGIYGSLFPLAAWIVEHWWQLMHEPSPRSPLRSGRVAPVDLRGWFQRHSLLAARDGGALPDLTIARDGDEILLQWEPDPAAGASRRLRFVGQGAARVHAEDFERELSAFVDAVLARLNEHLSEEEEVRRLTDAWNVVRSADGPERTLCESLAVMGVDPYDPDEATDDLIGAVERGIRNLPSDLRADLLEGSSAESFAANLDWVEQERSGLGGTIVAASFPTIHLPASPTSHETGYLAAHRVRSELLGLRSDDPVPDLESVLVGRLGWSGNLKRTAAGTDRLHGMVGLDSASSAPLLVIPGTRTERAERFRLARAAFFPVTMNIAGGARLLTGSVTRPQRAARAFAAELLAPAAALRGRVSGRVSDQEVEDLADEFRVSTLVILHQLENHDIGYAEA
jgi:hypothetical protein